MGSCGNVSIRIGVGNEDKATDEPAHASINKHTEKKMLIYRIFISTDLQQEDGMQHEKSLLDLYPLSKNKVSK